MHLRIMILSVCLGVSLLAQKSGIDKGDLDTKCKPCDDFWRYANGTWIDKNPIPDRFARWGTMAVVNEANRERLKTILDAAVVSKAAAGTPERQIGDLYGACLDTSAIDALGVKPLQPDLDRVAAIKDVEGLKSTIVFFQKQTGAGPIAIFALPDLKNSKEMIANVGAGGISLPDRDYYFKEDPRSVKIREEYLKHVERMFVLLGDAQDKAAAHAKTVMNFETAMAGTMMTNVQRRDPYARYHKMDLTGLNALTPDFSWTPIFKLLNIAETTPVNATEPEVLKKFNSQLTALPLDDWKTWLRWRLVNGAADYLSKPFRDEDFAFSGTVLTGVKEQLPRWQQCANTVDRTLGDALGQVFVAKHFPPAAKKRMLELVENLRATLREELQSADWLAPETKKNAVAKLNAFAAKIGYPERWRDYSKVDIQRSSFYSSLRAASLNNRMYQLSKIGKPIDRNDWGMTPPTVNAYYNPPQNNINFPAGILQPPFFDNEVDDA
ncbi:MAG: M13 family metallopeptidase, partial [Acidobacteria bacterium]|nr:M13 family metallopeptidase [Acidobacteriota bacterium]